MARYAEQSRSPRGPWKEEHWFANSHPNVGREFPNPFVIDPFRPAYLPVPSINSRRTTQFEHRTLKVRFRDRDRPESLPTSSFHVRFYLSFLIFETIEIVQWLIWKQKDFCEKWKLECSAIILCCCSTPNDGAKKFSRIIRRYRKPDDFRHCKPHRGTSECRDTAWASIWDPEWMIFQRNRCTRSIEWSAPVRRNRKWSRQQESVECAVGRGPGAGGETYLISLVLSDDQVARDNVESVSAL